MRGLGAAGAAGRLGIASAKKCVQYESSLRQRIKISVRLPPSCRRLGWLRLAHTMSRVLSSSPWTRERLPAESRESAPIPSRMTGPETSPRPPLVLLANDQEWSARSLESILGPSGYAVLRAYTGRQVLDLVRTTQPDLLIVDVRLPDMSGIDICRTLRDDPRFSASTPLIVTTSGPSERSERLAAHEAGAWEVVSQPLDGEALIFKLNSFLRAKREVDRLRDESLIDPSTGLYNMRGLARRAHEISAQAQRVHGSLACVALSPLADSPPSAAAGDQTTFTVVEHCGAVLRRAGRASDAIGRLGPAEFAIIAAGTEGPGVVRLIERMRDSIEAQPIELGGESRRLTVRAGYCAVSDFSASGVDAVEMLLRATSALRDLRDDQQSGPFMRACEELPVRS